METTISFIIFDKKENVYLIAILRRNKAYT